MLHMTITFTEIKLPEAPLELQEKINEYEIHGYELLVIQQVTYISLSSTNFTVLLYNGKENVILDFDEKRLGLRVKANSFFDYDIAWALMFSPALQKTVSDIPLKRSVAI
jgi:hypothetical protein